VKKLSFTRHKTEYRAGWFDNAILIELCPLKVGWVYQVCKGVDVIHVAPVAKMRRSA